jgi:hypothetical protein
MAQRRLDAGLDVRGVLIPNPAMKVLDLRCAAGHGFEGWFASDDEFGAQRAGGLLDCLVCGDADIVRLPSAPRLNLGAARAPAAIPGMPAAPAAPDGAASRLAELLSRCEDVGSRFAEEARRIHYGEREPAPIVGRTTPAERESLADEGIEVLTLPVPAAGDPLQ